MALNKKQLRELKTEYIPPLTKQMHIKQDMIFTELKEIKEKQEKVTKWKHRHEKDFPILLQYMKTVLCPQVDKLTEAIKILIGKRDAR